MGVAGFAQVLVKRCCNRLSRGVPVGRARFLDEELGLGLSERASYHQLLLRRLMLQLFLQIELSRAERLRQLRLVTSLTLLGLFCQGGWLS